MTGPQQPPQDPFQPPAADWGRAPGWSGGEPPAAPSTAGGYDPASYGPPAGPAQTDTRAIVALVLAIASFVVLPLVPAVVALVLAQRSRRDIAASGGRLTGEGLATAARVVAWVNIVLCVLAVLAVVALFTLFAVYGFGP
jgi:uncharacterized membrane protein YjgN (DUF898 family)